MTAEELTGELLGIIFVLADEIYFQKCIYLNVVRLSEAEEKACVDEAIKALPEFLETYKKYSDALKDMGVEVPELKCVYECGGGCLDCMKTQELLTGELANEE